MSIKEPSFTIGIEEEYLLVDKETRGLVIEPPDTLMAEAEEKCGAQVTSELLKSQIEIGTKGCSNIQEAHEDLARLRRNIIDVADNHGIAPIAASTHPFSEWKAQKHTEKDRYDQLTHEMQGAARRLLICGMHVHVGIDDDELRIDLMNQLSYFLPHLLALSCSSPFWLGHDTGLKSYRTSVFRSLPRTGMPDEFNSWGDYRRHVEALAGRIGERNVWRPAALAGAAGYIRASLAGAGYEVQVAADAVSSRVASNRHIGLRRACEAGAQLTSVEMALFELLRTATHPAFRDVLKIVR